MNTVKSWRTVLDIIAKYKGDDAECFHSEHDEITLNLTDDDVSPGSIDGKALKRLGCVIENERWKTFASL